MYKSIDRRTGARAAAGAVLWAALLGGCAALVPQTMELRTAWPHGVQDRADIAAVPFFPQLDQQCGPAALATALVHAGVAVTPEELAPRVYLPSRQGSLQADMLAAPRRYGVVSYPLAPRYTDLLREVAAGHPVIVLQDNGFGPLQEWHYAVVIGFDYAAGTLYLRSGTTQRLAIPFTVFEYTWKKSGYWAMVIPPAGRLPVTATEPGYLLAIAALERTAQPAAVIAAYSAFLQRWPDNVIASLGLANQQYALGTLTAAEDTLRLAWALNPDSIPLLNNLAQVMSDLGRDAEALATIEQAVAIGAHPFETMVRDTYQHILQRAGRDRTGAN